MRAYARTIMLLVAGLVALIGAICGVQLQSTNELQKYVIDINTAVAELSNGMIKIKTSLSSLTYVMTVDTHGKLLILSVSTPRIASTDYVLAICNGTQVQKPLSDYTVIGSGVCKIYVKCDEPISMKVILTE